MSESDLADLRSFYEAVAIGNLPVALSALHPEVEVHPPESWPDSEFALRGHEGMSEYLRKLAELFEDYDMEPERYFDLGSGRVLVLVREGGRGKGSFGEVNSRPTAHAWTMRGARGLRLDVYWDREIAFEAHGFRPPA
ncbi:MAG: nuclear transport factor 2 family protein [Thermoleophilaceae bacterium]|nr:nuclear transport factor 2 family protein [Thermoleophilaceae bacterium]